MKKIIPLKMCDLKAVSTLKLNFQCDVIYEQSQTAIIINMY